MKKIFCDDCKEEKKENEVSNSINESIPDHLQGQTVVVRSEVLYFTDETKTPELCTACLWKTINKALNPEEIKKRKADEDIPF